MWVGVVRGYARIALQKRGLVSLRQAAYSIVALRLNENAPSRAAGRVLFRNIKINDKGEVAR